MVDKFEYKVIDYANIDHHNNEDVQKFLNDLGKSGYELLEVLDMGENNSNNEGKSSRYRYILKKNV